MGEDILVQTGNQVELGSSECEARLLQFDGDGNLTRASVDWEVGYLKNKNKLISSSHTKTLSDPYYY